MWSPFASPFAPLTTPALAGGQKGGPRGGRLALQAGSPLGVHSVNRFLAEGPLEGPGAT